MITQTRSNRGTELTYPGFEALDVRLERLADYAQIAHEPKRLGVGFGTDARPTPATNWDNKC